MQLRLERRAYLPHVTLGVLVYGRKTLVTLEPPWRGNKVRESCIPEGRYVCSRVNSPKFGRTWEVNGVSGREDILFHGGNTPKDTEGCILLGQMLSEQEYAIVQSRAAMSEFLRDTENLAVMDLLVVPYRPVS